MHKGNKSDGFQYIIYKNSCVIRRNIWDILHSRSIECAAEMLKFSNDQLSSSSLFLLKAFFVVVIMIYLENIKPRVISTTDSENIKVVFSLDTVLRSSG